MICSNIIIADLLRDRDVETQGGSEQPVAEVEAMPQRIAEWCIQHQSAATQDARLALEACHQMLAMPTAAQGSIGDQVVDIQEAAVHEVLLHSKTCQRDHARALKQRQEAIATGHLAAPAVDKLIFGGKVWPQLRHQRVATPDTILVVDILRDRRRGDHEEFPDAECSTATWGANRSAPAMRFQALMALTATVRNVISLSENCSCSSA